MSRNQSRSRLSVVVAVAATLVAATAVNAEPGVTPGVPIRPGPFRGGVVSVSHPLAAEVGARILERGGNAVDAAVAIQLALNVVEPQFSGIGGGGFMMIHRAAEDETVVIDSRERAPAAATPDLFTAIPADVRFELASTSGISVGVPGTLLGVATALDEYGTISLDQALRPAIRLAANGFPVNFDLAFHSGNPRNLNHAETTRLFRRPDGTPLQVGDLLVQPELAQTFRLIARRGPEVFYEGRIAQAIVDAQTMVRDDGGGLPGVMTTDDLADYDVALRQPLVADYRGYTIKSMPPPSSGGLAMLQMLKLLERYPLGDVAQGYGFGSPQTAHVMVESMRLAFADRAMWMGDDDFVPVPTEGLLNDDYVNQRAAMISTTTRMADPPPGDPFAFESAGAASATEPVELTEDRGHTTHFSVVDRWGNVVSYTTTIEDVWGSGITVPGYGFLLNNELTDFNLEPRANPATGDPGANDVAPGKRPRSSMTPTMLFRDGHPFAAYGSPGGSRIINTVLGITLNLIDHGMSIQQAIDAPRLSVTSPAGRVDLEPLYSWTAVRGLQALGHPLNEPRIIGSVQAVIIDLATGEQYGGADDRREGTVIGLPRGRGHCHSSSDVQSERCPRSSEG